MTGYNATDVLTFSNGIDWVDRNFPFFIIETVDNTKGKANFPFDGVLGLSPDISGDDYFTVGQPLPLFLKEKGKIAQAIVGIDMHKESTAQSSSMQLGKIDENKFRNKTEKIETLKWFYVSASTTRFAWRHEVRNILYNQKSFDDGFKNDGTFDSFYGGIHLPQVEWTKTFTEIQANLTAAGKNYLSCDMGNMTCYFNGACSHMKSDWNDFEFNFIDDRAYAVSADSYLLDSKDAQGRNICIVAVYGNKMHPTEYILGDVFMQSLYVVLDYENSRFAVNGNYRQVEVIGDKPVRPESGSMLWIIIGAVVGVLLLVAIIGGCIVRSKNRRLQNNLAKYEQL